MAKLKNLEPPREGLIKQEIISYERNVHGMIIVNRVVRHYYEDGIDYLDQSYSEPLTKWGKQNEHG
tara:strand:+ start:1208 stop:1405 length:198 start_codon:yes stop_codon:yes gene_type:complete